MRMKTLSALALGAGLAVAAYAPSVLAAAAPAARPATAATAAAPTPRTPDGRPDLTGLWQRRPEVVANRAFGFADGGKSEAYSGGQTYNIVRDGNIDYVEIDAEFLVKSYQDMPQYKPEFWDKLHQLEEFAYRRPADPEYGCKNPGVVRLAAPAEMFQTPGKVTLIYNGTSDDGTSAHIWVREVPTDGRPLPKPDDYDGLRPTGTSVGHWEGDTLVIETVDFPDDGVWYNRPGWFGSADAKVIERFHREGDTLAYDQTIDDPNFIKPWVRPTIYMLANNNPKTLLAQPLSCVEHDADLLPPSSK